MARNAIGTWYERDVMPVIVTLTAYDLARVTGLSSNHCWQVRTGGKKLHPMHWQKLVSFAMKRS
jgi:hypothetical protein